MKRIIYLTSWALVVLSLLIIVSCSTDEVVEMTEPFGIERLITSVACDEGCGIVADCEGDRVTITGMIDGSELDTAAMLWTIYDLDDDMATMEVELSNAFRREVLTEIGDTLVTVVATGILDGYDSAAGTTCVRRLVLQVGEREDIVVE